MMKADAKAPTALNDAAPSARPQPRFETAFGCPRDAFGNRFVYAVISPRARGLSLGVNMNPGKYCDFDCAYCEVTRCAPGLQMPLDVEAMADELQATLHLARSGRLRELERYQTTPPALLELRHVALSGDGEPTLCPNFAEAVQTVAHARARILFFFKLVLITNATGLHLPEVQNGLRYFTADDEIWAKLDAGTDAWFQRVNGVHVPLEHILTNILCEARRRPVIIQSLFPTLHGEEPPDAEIAEYAERLRELKTAGARIPLVQIYSATRPTPHSECGHLSLRALSRIADTVRRVAGLNAEVF